MAFVGKCISASSVVSVAPLGGHQVPRLNLRQQTGAIEDWDVLRLVVSFSARRIFSGLTKSFLHSGQSVDGLIRAAAGIVSSCDFAPGLGADRLLDFTTKHWRRFG